MEEIWQDRQVIYRCQDSLEGILTGVYNVYEDKTARENAILSLTDEAFLFAEERVVTPDAEKTGKVVRTLIRQFGYDDYESICFALSTPEEDKAQAVFRTIAAGIDRKTGTGELLHNLADENIHRCFKLARAASREHCHLQGFLRFEELENGILYSRFEPKNNLLTFLLPHFADRFPMEDFVIYDAGRGIFGVHPKGKKWYLMQGAEPEIKDSEEEICYKELFRHFCDKIAIQERYNPKLQRNMLPLHFREYMPEFKHE